MDYTRREFGRLALATLPATALFEKALSGAALAQAKPNSMFNGVQIGTITYSYRSMPDQSAEATLKYILDCGISAIELMGGPAESFAGAPSGRAGGAGRGAAGPGGPGGPGGGGAAAAAGAALPGGAGGGRAAAPCVPGEARAGGGGGRAAGRAGAGAGAAEADAAGARRGGGGGRAAASPEQQAAAEELKKWRTSVSMDKFKALRKMYNDAGVTIYAWKQLSPNMSDEEFEYVFNVAEALGCTHTTLELPTDAAQLKRIGDFAMKKKIYAAYHTHAQGNITVFDQAFAASKGNTANVDFGHYVAGGGGNPVLFLEKFHDRISSFHLKDRTTPEHCALNIAWGTGDTPIKELLQTVRKNKWKMPASIELEYSVPADSDAVKETKKCVQYCKDALMA